MIRRQDTEDGGWDLYTRTWRPGKPHRERWVASWAAAKVAVACQSSHEKARFSIN